MSGEENKIQQQRICIIVLIALLIIMLFIMLGQCSQSGETGQTAVIEENPQVELTDAENGIIRIKISPVIDIRNKTMQNMNFCNYNQGRLLRCKIKFGEEYVYDSGFLAEGKILKGDFIRDEGLAPGNNEAIAEIYSKSEAKRA